jgi:peptidoglycan/LPS O-acetylase OafA/YrhL
MTVPSSQATTIETPLASRGGSGARIMPHSASIDGLRALAVIAVIIFHAFPYALGGGYLGVDVFFVISGFLITQIIVSESQAGTFSIARFYKRRVLRIFPALFLTIAVVLVAGYFLSPPKEFREIGQAAAAASLFASNILFWTKGGYFDAAAEANPLVHTWSLAVEEQFYLAAPLLAYFAVRGLRVMLLSICGLIAVSLTFAVWTSQTVPSTWFFFTLNRVFELGVGSLVAILRLHIWDRPGHLTAQVPGGQLFAVGSLSASVFLNALIAVCLSILIWCFFTFDVSTHHPGLITLLPVIATALMLAFHDQPTAVHRMLSARWLVSIGLISYSLYLWHQPILIFARTWNIVDLTLTQTGLCLLVSFALAYLSWRYVERYFRNYDHFQTRNTFAMACLAGGLLVAGGVTIHLMNGLATRYPVATQSFALGDRPAPAFAAAAVGQVPKIVFWGDSHAEMLHKGMRAVVQSDGEHVELLHLGGCPPIPGFDNAWRNSGGERCSHFNARILRTMSERPASVVILAARWPNYLRPPGANDEFGHKSSLISRSIFPSSFEAWQPFDIRRAAASQLREALQTLIQSGHDVVVVRSVPTHPYDGENLAYRVGADPIKLDAYGVPRAVYTASNSLADQIIDDATAGLPRVRTVSPASSMCQGERCRYSINGVSGYSDTNHTNSIGSQYIASQILDHLLRLPKR